MVLDSFQGSVPQNRPFVSVVSPDLKISYRETSLSFIVRCLANWKLEPLKFGGSSCG